MRKEGVGMKLKLPFIIATLGMVLGVFISILFGINESYFKDKISQDLQKNKKISKIMDADARKAKLSKEKSKNWRYYQRFHFHATGISGLSLALLVIVAFSRGPALLKLISSYSISFGGFLYPYVWFFAALYGPIIGRHEAKESFAVFGYMGGVFLIGLLLAMTLLVKYPLKFIKEN